MRGFLRHKLDVSTPSFVFDIGELRRQASDIRKVVCEYNGRLLFSVKSFALAAGIAELADLVDGFSTSSLFEAKLAAAYGRPENLIHYVSPLLGSSKINELCDTCAGVTLNSFGQLDRFSHYLREKVELGIRVNPRLSFASDSRYDPCRSNSKLGVSIERLADGLRSNLPCLQHVTGLHFHSNCGSSDLKELAGVTRRIRTTLGDNLCKFRWLNVGGGYSFAAKSGADELMMEFLQLSEQYGLQIVIEPGAAVSGAAGFFVSTVEDILQEDNHPVAVLDLTVNHWPEVFEYQFEPDVDGHIDGGRFTYILAGCSCLAGDVFGEYSFSEPLEVGSRLVFPNAGAYSIVKAHMFNGINLPNIYALTESDELVLIKQFTYEDFASRCGVDISASIGI